MSKIRMIAVDMDGTFLDSQGQYDRERFGRLFEQLKAKGVHFVVASGNRMSRLQQIFGDLAPELAYVAENGAQLVVSGETRYVAALSRTELDMIFDFLARNLPEAAPFVAGLNRLYQLEKTDMGQVTIPFSQAELAEFLAQFEQVTSFDVLPQDETYVQVTLVTDAASATQWATIFNQAQLGLRAVTSGFGALDILKAGVDKGTSLQRLLDLEGVSADQLMAFGDSENDLEMLKLAKYSFAMSNASDTVKVAARHLAPGHDEAGVLSVIETYLAQGYFD